MTENQNGTYLVHHGILGQKWGKRNGPPYPIDAKDHSNSEKKAGWRSSLEKGYKVAKAVSSSAQPADKDGIANKPKYSNHVLVDGAPQGPDKEHQDRMRDRTTSYKNMSKDIDEATRNAHAVVDSAKSIKKTIDKRKEDSENSDEEIRQELDTMSDDDLRKVINRYNMEQQYIRIKKDDVKRGKDTVDKSLDIANTVITFTGAAATTGYAIYKILKKM